MPLIECVPNFSDGRNPAVIDAIAAAITAARGRVLDRSLDASHHRAVITFVAESYDIVDAAFAAIATARDLIDLRQHQGVHPRIGAADVVPFIPLDGTTMDQCVAAAHALSARVGRELQIPVYLYEHAARRPAYRNLADVRRGGLAALAASISTTRPPDDGPSALHPTAGAVAIGARHFLGAFNVFIGAADRLPIAHTIAREIRAASGGLPGVKALGLIVDHQAQVSMNVTDLSAVALHEAFDAVATAALAHGVTATHSEIIGLVPQRTIERAFADRIRLRDQRDTVSLEQRITATRPSDDLSQTAHAIAALDQPTASGSAAALAAILASATVRLAAGVHAARAASPVADAMRAVLPRAELLERDLHHAARDDAAAWHRVVLARRARHSAPSNAAHLHAVDEALLAASAVPFRIATLATDVLALASQVASAGDRVTAPDAWTGATLAHATVTASLGLARGNLAVLSAPELGDAMRRDAAHLHKRATDLLSAARVAVGQIAM
jgi:glutamate formiminotransferase / formiminotetrahydrofolate cyclodeaminase